MKLFTKKYRKRTEYIATGVIVLGVITLGIVNVGYIKDRLNDWKLFPEPEKLTELYFSDSDNLPSTYIPNQAQTVTFIVHNLEYSTWKYKYVLGYVDGHKLVVLNSGSFTLAENQFKVVPVSFSVSDLGNRIQIAVVLGNPNEAIDYWMSRIGT